MNKKEQTLLLGTLPLMITLSGCAKQTKRGRERRGQESVMVIVRTVGEVVRKPQLIWGGLALFSFLALVIFIIIKVKSKQFRRHHKERRRLLKKKGFSGEQIKDESTLLEQRRKDAIIQTSQAAKSEAGQSTPLVSPQRPIGSELPIGQVNNPNPESVSLDSSRPLATEGIQDTPIRLVDDQTILENRSRKAIAECQNGWAVLGASVQGNGHRKKNIVCQDYHAYKSLGGGWGIAIVSDGAGSARHSDIGSKIVGERGLVRFAELIEARGWQRENTIPSQMDWEWDAYYTLKRIYEDMKHWVQTKAKQPNAPKDLRPEDLAATAIVVIHAPKFSLITHIGDGRAGYKSESGEWCPLITPHKGEEANQTTFITSEPGVKSPSKMSGKRVPESYVLEEAIQGFVLMSDGCERASFRCTAQDPVTERYYDPNTPHQPFFHSIEESLLGMIQARISSEEQATRWYNFLDRGNKALETEQDDKTMLLGLRLPKETEAE